MSAALPVILVGCDPELFVQDSKTKAFISARNLLPGTKKEPFPVPKGAIQVDGVAAEFNIIPTSSPADFINNIKTVLSTLKERIGSGKRLEIVPTATFSEEAWGKIPVSAKILGCDPDYNAYTLSPNPAPNPHGRPMRTAAGHVHVGFLSGKDQSKDPYNPVHQEDCAAVVRELDFTLGLPSLWWDSDNERRTLYGKAGAYRPKPYGVEYRTLSNRWLENERLMEFVHRTAVATVLGMFRGAPLLFDLYGEFAKDAINAGDKTWNKTETGQKLYRDLYGRIPLPLVVSDKAPTEKKPAPKRKSLADFAPSPDSSPAFSNVELATILAQPSAPNVPISGIDIESIVSDTFDLGGEAF